MTMRQVNSIMSAQLNEKNGAIVAGDGWRRRPPRTKRQLFDLGCRRQGIFDEREIDRLWRIEGQTTRHARRKQ